MVYEEPVEYCKHDKTKKDRKTGALLTSTAEGQNRWQGDPYPFLTPYDPTPPDLGRELEDLVLTTRKDRTRTQSAMKTLIPVAAPEIAHRTVLSRKPNA